MKDPVVEWKKCNFEVKNDELPRSLAYFLASYKMVKKAPTVDSIMILVDDKDRIDNIAKSILVSYKDELKTNVIATKFLKLELTDILMSYLKDIGSKMKHLMADVHDLLDKVTDAIDTVLKAKDLKSLGAAEKTMMNFSKFIEASCFEKKTAQNLASYGPKINSCIKELTNNVEKQENGKDVGKKIDLGFEELQKLRRQLVDIARTGELPKVVRELT